MSNGEPVAVVGAGAWGTTLATYLAALGLDVRLATRSATHAAAIVETAENTRYLPGVAIPSSIDVTADLERALRGARCVFIVVPSQAVRLTSEMVGKSVGGDTLLVSCSKGLEQGSLSRLSEVLREAGGFRRERIAVLSGPNLSGEIARGLPASAVVASDSAEVARFVQTLLSSSRFRVYTSLDVAGVELGGALKNVIALGAGVGDGLAMGQNAKAAFITRGLAEMTRLGVAMGANPLTFGGLSGLGDLIATCESPLSRNRTFGQLISEGLTLDEAHRQIGHVVEGALTAPAMVELGRRHGVETPIAAAMVEVLEGRITVKDAIVGLLTRDQRSELD